MSVIVSKSKNLRGRKQILRCAQNDTTGASQSVYLRLLARIHQQYQTVSDTLDLAGRKIKFVRVADPNRVLDQVAEEEDRLEKLRGERTNADYLHLPYWAELWDSALGMSQLLVRKYSDSTARVLDLGCGMGLTGSVACSLGLPVLFADLEPPALLFAKVNSLSFTDMARTRQLNWQTDTLEEQFDLILGADILYERKQWEYLERFWRRHLAADGRVLLGEPGRQTGDDFPAWVTPRGWHVSYHEEKVATREKAIRLFELRIA